MAIVACAVAGARIAAAQGDTVRATKTGGVIDGVVADTALHPLAGSTVQIAGTEVQVVTGANGRFRFLSVPAGEHSLLIRKVGFEPVALPVIVVLSDTVRLSVALEIASTRLAEARVITSAARSPKLAEFEARRLLDQGQYITRDQIDQRNSPSVAGLLIGIRGLQVVQSSSPFGGNVAANRRSKPGQVCPMEIYVDGIPAGTTDLDKLPSPKEIAAIEVYSGAATIPIQYKRPGLGFCGLILVWTRDGP